MKPRTNMLRIKDSMGIKKSATSGIDCKSFCKDKKYFKNYPKNVTYEYNSMGFRDREWPEDLSDVVWCVGDSFTVGTGQPFEETWPQVLERKLGKKNRWYMPWVVRKYGKRCLNLGEDGCSNDTMALRVNELYNLHAPKLIIVMWSYLARRRINGENVAYNKDDFGVDEDMINFNKNFVQLNQLPTNIIHSIIPFAFENEKLLQEKYKNLIVTEQLDYARDYHHFDIKTSELVTNQMVEKINHLDKSSKYPI